MPIDTTTIFHLFFNDCFGFGPITQFPLDYCALLWNWK